MRGRKPQLVVDNPAPQKAPPAPASLGTVGRREWRKVAPILAANGLLPLEVETLLISYCAAIEGAEDCARILKKQGRVFSQKGLPPKAHPAVRQHLQYQGMALRYAESLGLTATARARNGKKAPGHGNAATLDY